MEFVRNLYSIKSHHKNCILTIGNFDGFHRGHQFLIARLREERSRSQAPLVVMLFEPQPREYFSSVITMRLTRLRDKISYLSIAGVDVVLCITFNKQFAAIDEYSFVRNILVSTLKVRCICIGDDFRFGAFRRGDFVFLENIGKSAGFKVVCSTTCLDDTGRRISSTAVRVALLEDRILDAESLLGHSYCISGRVVHGNSLGRVIGFPTANVSLQGKILPICGVYAVKVYGIFNYPLPGVANIGIRPTVTQGIQQKLEVHLLNISADLYTYHIKIVFLFKIRNERCFDSLQSLQNQIKNDIIIARDYFYQKNYFLKL